jgi:hypothetical protein
VPTRAASGMRVADWGDLITTWGAQMWTWDGSDLALIYFSGPGGVRRVGTAYQPVAYVEVQ